MIYEFPDMQFSSALSTIRFKRKSLSDILAPIEFLSEKIKQKKASTDQDSAANWLMGQVHHQATGNVNMADLRQQIEQIIK